MSQEKFDWKSLFINTDEEDVSAGKKEVKHSNTTSQSFPEKGSSQKFPDTPPMPSTLGENVLNTIIEMYEAGFDGLNQPGYDFYEFFKAIKAVGSNDPQVYKMALTMAQSVDNKVSKASLLEQANYYIEEIEKVHQKYKSQGTTKKANIQDANRTKKEQLSSEITELEKKLMQIQNEISTKKNDLQTIDVDMLAEISEIDQKITANDVAKSKILETITSVQEGIKNNL